MWNQQWKDDTNAGISLRKCQPTYLYKRERDVSHIGNLWWTMDDGFSFVGMKRVTRDRRNR